MNRPRLESVHISKDGAFRRKPKLWHVQKIEHHCRVVVHVPRSLVVDDTEAQPHLVVSTPGVQLEELVLTDAAVGAVAGFESNPL